MGKYYYDLSSEINSMKKKMDQLMENALDRFDLDNRSQENKALWQPMADAYETDTYYIVQMELSGIPRDQICIEVKNNELWVYGERRLIKEASGSKYHILERSYGPFARKFRMPKNTDSNNIKARYQDGLLTIFIAKTVQSGKSIKIEVDQE